VTRDWLLITVSTPGGRSSTLRVYAWRNLRSLGAHYLQQSVCLLPATPKTTRAVTRLVTRLRAEGGHVRVRDLVGVTADLLDEHTQLVRRLPARHGLAQRGRRGTVSAEHRFCRGLTQGAQSLVHARDGA